MNEPFAPFVFTAPLELDLEAEDAAAQLIALRATTSAAPWRDAAAVVWMRVVEDLREDEARDLLAAIVESYVPDPPQLFALADELGAKLLDCDPKWAAALRKEALAVALAKPVHTERALELAGQLVHDLDEALEREAIPPVIAELVARLPERAYALRLKFFDALRGGWRTQQLAAEQAREALVLAPDREARLDLLTKLAAMYGSEGRSDEEHRETWLAERAALVPELEALVAQLAPSAAVVRAHLELAADLYPGWRHELRHEPAEVVAIPAGLAALAREVADGLASERGPEPPPTRAQLDHVARADELARSVGLEVALIHEAAHAHAELLVRIGDLAAAERVLSTLPGLDDDHLSTLGFLEDLRRRLGLAGEPPPEAFVAHGPPDPLFDFFSKVELPEGFAAYFTRDPDPLAMLVDNRHASPEKVREWSHGGVRSEADLDSQKIFGPARDYACECTRYLGVRYRGFVCERCGVEVIQAITRTYRPGHVSLARPVLHPWYLAPLAQLFDTTQAALRAMDPDELHDALRRIDPYDVERVRNSYSRRDQAKVPVLEALRESLVRAEWLLLTILPVWAPAAPLPAGVDRAKLRAAYVATLAPEPQRGVDALFALFKR